MGHHICHRPFAGSPKNTQVKPTPLSAARLLRCWMQGKKPSLMKKPGTAQDKLAISCYHTLGERYIFMCLKGPFPFLNNGAKSHFSAFNSTAQLGTAEHQPIQTWLLSIISWLTGQNIASRQRHLTASSQKHHTGPWAHPNPWNAPFFPVLIRIQDFWFCFLPASCAPLCAVSGKLLLCISITSDAKWDKMLNPKAGWHFRCFIGGFVCALFLLVLRCSQKQKRNTCKTRGNICKVKVSFGNIFS